MSKATLSGKQMGKFIELFGDTPVEQVQALFASGLLADLRDANIAEIDREKFRSVCGLKPLSLSPHQINCDIKPFEPSGLIVAPKSDQLPNRVCGTFAFDPTKVMLYVSPNQRGGKYIEDNKLHKDLASKPVLPANVLDFYLANPQFIPEEWKSRAVFFWGTIYRDSHGRSCVRSLSCSAGGWRSCYAWLGYDWYDYNPVAVRAS